MGFDCRVQEAISINIARKDAVAHVGQSSQLRRVLHSNIVVAICHCGLCWNRHVLKRPYLASPFVAFIMPDLKRTDFAALRSTIRAPCRYKEI
jgi:hypothetical protein